jgi:hypothetical protein
MSEVGWPVTLPGPANDGEGMLRSFSLRQSTVGSNPLHEDGTGAVKLCENTLAFTKNIALTGPPGGGLVGDMGNEIWTVCLR